MGPGHWFKVTGDPGAFTNPVKTLNGDVIDMETYGLANGTAWHALWFTLGSAWLLWWVRRPLFIPRYKMLHSGQGKWLITSLDRKIATGILFGVPLFVLGANAMTDLQYPNAIPLQAGMDQIEPLPSAVNDGVVRVKVQRTEYHVPARSITITAQIQNTSDQPIRIGEFATANVRFLNPGVSPSRTDDTDTVIAPQGLSLDSADPIQAGETRTVRVTALDALWATQRLDGLIRDADTRMGGLLFLYDTNGKRHIASISTAVIPKFD
jgi:methane/ammonia monooxygenase subunit B